MTGDVINLKRARKQREKAEDEAKAAANRAKFGMSKAEKLKLRSEAARDEKNLDGHKRET